MNRSDESPESATLEPLVRAVCELESQRGVTPVLVVDPRLVLADEFYVTLCRLLANRTGRSIRLEALPGHRFASNGRGSGWLSHPWVPAPLASPILAPLRRRALRRVAARLPGEARLEPTLAVARPAGMLRELVVGLAGPRDELPRFAQEILLGANPPLPPAR